ncbi:MAG: hypothetical protein RI907_2917 [Pseudomonadota bacterium]|jgi:hypothetical protein
MMDFESLADVKSAIHQIDLLIAGLQAQRDQCQRAAAQFGAPAPQTAGLASAPVPVVAQAGGLAGQAQCAPCSGPR